jgi:hypothetical protein
VLIAGGYKEVGLGRRLVAGHESAGPGRVVFAGGAPRRARARHVDINDPGPIGAASDGVSTVVAGVRQHEPHSLHTVDCDGLAHTSIAPPRSPWPSFEQRHTKGQDGTR